MEQELITGEFALLAKEPTSTAKGTTFLADTGASTHMVRTDDGMFDCKNINKPVIIGNWKTLIATKIGKLQRTALQRDGSTQDIVLEEVKFVPGLDMPLFGILKACDQGWKIDNHGVQLTLSKGKAKISFDRVITTSNGKLVGITLLPNSGNVQGSEIAMPAREVFTENKPKKTWDINQLHQVFNHANEETLRKTAKAYDWEVTGKMERCQQCVESNIKKNPVDKYTEVKSESPGERIFIDTTSIKHRSLGGARFLHGVVDDCTGFTWGKAMKRKKDQVPTLMTFLRQMKARGTPVKFIRCDNAGENQDLQTKVEQSNDLMDIQFEFTARDNPQPNGKIERKFATVFARARANFEAAKLSRELRNKLWAEACSTAIDIENLIVSAKHNNPSYREFFKRDLPCAEEMKQFGEMGVLKTTKKIRGKLENRGIPVMYLGRARNHAGDTHRFLNLQTELVLISRDVIWLNKVYGDYKGTHKEVRWDRIGTLPKAIKDVPEPQLQAVPHAQQNEGQQHDGHGEQNVRRNQVEHTQDTGVRTRSQGFMGSAPDTSSVKRNTRELQALGLSVTNDDGNEGTTDENENREESQHESTMKPPNQIEWQQLSHSH